MVLPLHLFPAASSPYETLTPASRILCALAFSCCFALLQGVPAACAAAALGALALALARPAFKTALARLAAANFFLAFLWFFLPFSLPGRAVFSLGPLTASAEGLRAAALATLKGNALLCVFAGMVASMDAAAIGHGLQTLRAPTQLTHLLLFAARYVRVIADEYHRLRTAMRIRSFQPRCDMHTYRSYAYLVGMLLTRSWERAERVHRAMLCRGFDGRFHSLREHPWRRRDALALGLCLLLAGAALSYDLFARY